MSEELLIRHCSPTLAGMKTGSLFAGEFCDEEKLRECMRCWNRMLTRKGVRAVPLQFKDGRALIYADVVVRVHRDFNLSMHVDTDEANAFSSDAEPYGVIIQLFGDNYNTDKWIDEVLSGIHR